MSVLKTDGYTPALDGLRALAVLSVIANHFYEKLIPGGYLGVDIFFVLSGFVITTSLIKRRETDAKIFFTGFYKRRIKRLIPALLLCFCTASFLISAFTLFPAPRIITGLFSIPGFSNISLYLDNINYWGSSAKLNPFTHTWSLGVEEQFYFTYPLLIWLTTRHDWSSAGLKQLRLVLLIACSISLASFLYFSIDSPDMTYLLSPFRFWEIGAGCLLYLQLKIRGELFSSFIKKLSLSWLLALVIGVLFIPKQYTILTTFLIVLFSVLMIWKIMLEEGVTRPNPFLTNRTSLYLGKISYSLYLWHWVVIVICRWTIGINVLFLPFELLIIFLAAAFSYHVVEKPLRHSSWRRSVKARTILVPLGVIALLFPVYLKLNHGNNLLYLGNKKQELSKAPDISKLLAGYKEPRHCTKMRILGNSHSLSIVPMLEVIAKQTNIKIIHEDDLHYIEIPNGDQKDIGKLDNVLAALTKGDMLVLCSRNRYLYEQPYLDARGEKWIDHSAEKKEKGYGLSIWLRELDTVIARAYDSGINVVLFMPNVEFDKEVTHPELCRKEWFRILSEDNNPTVSRAYLEKRFPKEFYEQVNLRTSTKPNFFAFDPLPILCTSAVKCSRIINGVAAFSDTNHITPEGGNLMLPEFVSFLIRNKLL